MKKLLLLLFLPLSFFCCKTTTYTLDELPDTRVYFGEGGGFAGTLTEYLLLPNGQLFVKPQGTSTFVELNGLARKESKLLFKQLDSLRLHKYDFNKPGNLYKYLRQTDAEIDHRVTWGMPDVPVRPDVQRMYKSLKAAVEGKKRKDGEEEDEPKKEEEKPYGW
ncbi:MAG: hypothetical protein KDC44_00255 [Phaeodactylibacter sp.]|nr:hypothetical protein [Phaeodactylibacter sp.]